MACTLGRCGSVALALLFAAGCDFGDPIETDLDASVLDDGVPAPISGLTAIRLEPEDATVVLEEGGDATFTFTAIGTFEGGREEDISSRVNFRLRDRVRLGSFTGPMFRSAGSLGGVATVEARAGNVSALGTLTVILRRSSAIPPVEAPALPDDPGSLFGGDDDEARAPTLVYPNDGVVLPPNLGRIELHWLRGTDNELFALTFANDVTDVTAFVRCERPEGVRDDGCIWEPDRIFWDWVALTNAGSRPVELTIRGTDDEGTAVGTSATIALQFAEDELQGTIYYWTVSDGGAINRFDFGGEAGSAERVLGPESTESGRCVGCHALSRDGTKLVGSVGGQNRGGMVLMDLEAFEAVFNESENDDRIIQFASFRPDGDEMVGIYGDDTSSENFGDLLLFDTRCDAANMATCGLQTGRIDLGGVEASHPDWAPDDSRIAFTDVGRHRTSQRPGHGQIAYVARDGDGWTGVQVLVDRADGLNRYNPHYAPDTSFLVYNESTCPNGNEGDGDCNADTDPTATVWAVATAGGAPVELLRAQAPGVLDENGDLANTFPRFAPFVFLLDTGDLGDRRVMWLSFSSTRRYGIRPPLPSSSGESDRGTYLWMAAVEPEAVARGEDPSFAAFVLPFQDITTSNHIATWTTESVGEVPLD